MATTVIAAVTALLAIGGIFWRFSSVVSTLQVTLQHLGEAINKLESKIESFSKYGESLAAHDARIANLEHRTDKVEDRLQ